MIHVCNKLEEGIINILKNHDIDLLRERIQIIVRYTRRMKERMFGLKYK